MILKIKLKLNEHFPRKYSLFRRFFRALLSPISFTKKFAKISFSQYGEDLILTNFLSEEKGKYVEVGSGHPIIGNNTYFLYKRGWSGILIDPIRHYGWRTRLLRPRDRFLNNLVGVETEQIHFYEYEYGVASTADLDLVKSYEALGRKYLESYSVKPIRLSELGLRATPLDPEILNIDVEGMEMSVLLSVDWKIYNPRIICIEEKLNFTSEIPQTKSFLEAKGYVAVSRCYISTIYVHGSYLSHMGHKIN